MARIELVIEMDEDIYNHFINNKYSRADVIAAHTAIVTGMRLPKGHGDLIDRSMLPTDYITDDDIADASAIIKAHKESQK